MISLAKRWRAPILLGSVFLIFVIFPYLSKTPNNCTEVTKESQVQSELTKTQCLIEGSKKLVCLRDEKDVYLPFEKFLKKQFDLTGKLYAKGTPEERFEYYTSYSKVRVPEKLDYSSDGPFGHFAGYNVEMRDRVRCISAEHGVPMSIQWDNVPYFYPIQIAQYALQHYSRNKTDPAPKQVTIEAEFDPNTNLLQVENSADGGLRLSLHPEIDFIVLSFLWKPKGTSAAFSVVVRELRLNKTLILNYKHVDDRRCVWSENTGINDDYNEAVEDKEEQKQDELVFSYSLGSEFDLNDYTKITRDILVDTTKALSLVQMLPPNRKDSTTPGGLKIGDIRLVSLQFSGALTLRRPILQMTKAHGEMFIRTAEWFVKNQDEQGGWSVPVMRSIADNKLVLPAGWHSAMAQGHALSVLTRAYHLTKDIRYVRVAEHAVDMFKINAKDGGITNKIFGDYDWYEEYPTTPGSYVLNGFMYSLIGLYDFSTLKEFGNESRKLFDNGLNSLRIFLPLYDTGSGSIYDLRHVGLKTAPNLARWDYHAVHIYLLKWLETITGDKFLGEVADRWIGYAQGKRAKHN